MKITGDEWLSSFDIPAVPAGLKERVLNAAVQAASVWRQSSWIERLLGSRLVWASVGAVAGGLLLANLMVFKSGRSADETFSITWVPGTTVEKEYADIQATWGQYGISASAVNQWFEAGDNRPRLVDAIFDTPPVSATDELTK